MNELTIEEFDALSPDTYVLYDIRSTDEINHGATREPLQVPRKNWKKIRRKRKAKRSSSAAAAVA